MKKKKIGLALMMAVLVGLLAALAIGVFMANRQDTPTGNLADVEWYDENQEEFTITTVEELYDVVTLSYFYDFSGQTIKLGADIVVNEGNAEEWAEKAPKRKWHPIRDFAGTFDGQGHAISGVYGFSADTAMGMFANTKKSCVIQDFKLLNSYFETDGDLGTGSIAANCGGTFKKIYSDAIIQCDGGKVAGLFSKVIYDSTIEECWFAGSISSSRRFGGGIVDGVWGAKATIAHCLNTGSIYNDFTYQSCSIGGICGVAVKGGTLVVDDCLNVGTLETVNQIRVGSVVGGSDSNTISMVTNSFGTTESSKVAISTVISNLTGGAIQLDEAKLKGYGGYQWTTLDFDKYWTTVTDDTPILQCFADEVQSLEGVEKCFDTSWYDVNLPEFVIANEKQLYGLTYLSVSTDFAGKTIKLGADISLNKGKATDWSKTVPENTWIPVKKFAGTFDGQGHTLSGIYFKTGSDRVGLFCETTTDSTVKNVRLTNSYMESTGGIIGSIAGRGKGRFDTIYSNAIVTSSAAATGGIVGQMNEGNPVVTNCWFDGTVSMTTDSGSRGGGIVGFILNEKTNVIIDNCLFTGTIKCERKDGFSNAGGILGISGNKAVVTVKDCLSAGVLDVAYKGGTATVIGHIGEGSTTITNTYGVEAEYPGIAYTAAAATVKGGVIVFAEDRLIGYGGYQWTALDFNKYWTVVMTDTPILRSFATKIPSVAGIKKMFNLDWYNENKTSYTLNTAEDFYGFMILSATTDFKGKTVKLGADITLNTGNAADWSTTAPTNEWTPIQMFAGTFDGQGHTISGIYVNASNQRAGLFAETTVDSIVKNLRIENSYINNSEAIAGSVAGRGNGVFDTIYSNAIVSCAGPAVGGIVGQVQTGNKNSITNCWFDGQVVLTDDGAYQAGGIVGFVLRDGTALLIDNCLNSGGISSVRTSGASNVGGICGTVDVNANLILMNSLHTGTFTVKNKVGVGTAIGRLGSNTQVAIKETYGFASHSKGIGVLAGKPAGNVSLYPEKTLQGTDAYRMTGLDFDKYWMARAEKTPILKAFGNANEALNLAGIARANTSWYDDSKSEYTISSVEDLYGLTKLSTSTNFAGKTIKLGSDIILNTGNAAEWATSAPANGWVPIQMFAGTFDGQGHKISGVYVNSDSEKAGLFAEITVKSTIKNLRLENSYISSSNHIVGSIAGRGNGTFDTIYSNAILTSNGTAIGGIVGQINAGNANKLTNCWFAGEVNLTTDDAQRAGGIVGFILGSETKVVIDNCLNSGAMSSERTSGASNVGGIVGQVNATVNLTVQYSVHTGSFDVANANGVGTAIGNAGKATVNITETYGIAGNYKGISLGKVTTGSVTLYSEANLKGYEAYRMTELDFGTYWSAQKTRTPILKAFANVGDTLKITDEIIRANTDWYDESKSEYEISTEEEFYGFAKLSQTTNFAEKTIILTEDLTLNTLKTGETVKDLATKEVVNQWIPIGKTLAFEGTFDGQKHSISGIYVNEASDYVGLFGQSKGDIKNFRLTDSYIVAAGNMTGSIVGFAAGNVENVYSNAVVESTAVLNTNKEYECGGIVGRFGSGSEAIISNCWFDGTVSSNNRGCGGIVGRIAMGTKTIKNCLNTRTVTSTVSGTGVWVGGLVGATSAQTTVNARIQESLSVGTVTAPHFVGVGSVVGYVANNNNTTMTIAYTYAVKQKLSNANEMSAVGTGVVAGGTLLDKSAIEGNGAFQMTGLDFSNYWTAKTSVTPELKEFTLNTDCLTAPEKQVYMGWYNGNDGENIITSKAGLYGFAQLSETTNFVDETIQLGADIVINEGTLNPKDNDTEWNKVIADWEEWTPIGQTNYFKGTFEGNGYSIHGIYVTDSLNYDENSYAGLFSQTDSGAVIQNFSLKNSYIQCGGYYVGSIVGKSVGTDYHQIYSNAIVKGGSWMTGGLVGAVQGNGGTFTSCWFDGAMKLTNTSGQAGGIVGVVRNGTCSVTLENCLNSADISCARTGGKHWIGGLVGATRIGTPELNIRNSLNVGKITLSNANGVGAILGHVDAGSVTIRTTYGLQGYNAVGSGSATANVELYKDAESIQGDKAFQMKGLDFDNIWAVKAGKTPQLRYFTSEEGILPTPTTQVYTGWYDGGKGTYTITTAAGLRGLSELSASYNFAGSTIELGADITLNEGTLDPKGTQAEWNSVLANWNTWTPIGPVNLFNGTFDGQGHTIHGVYVTDSKGTEENSLAGLFAQTNVSAVIQNLRLEDSYIQGGGYYVGSIVGKSAGTDFYQVYSNAIVTGNSAMIGGLVGAVQGNGGTFTGCWYDGRMPLASDAWQAGGLIGCVRNGTAVETTIQDCLNTADISCKGTQKYDYIGGLVGVVRIHTPKLTIQKSLNVGAVTIEEDAFGVGVLVGYVMNGTLEMADSVYGIEGDYATVGYSASGTSIADNADLVDKNNLLGEKARTNAGKLEYDSVWSTVIDSTPVLAAFAEEVIVVADTSWYDAGKTEFKLTTAGELFGLAELSKTNSFAGITINLGEDILVNVGSASGWNVAIPANVWPQIGSPSVAFEGTFNGNGHTIRGIYVNDTEGAGYVGFFAQLKGDAKDFNLANSYFSSNGNMVGSIAGFCSGNIEGVSSKAIVVNNAATDTTKEFECGGLVGRFGSGYEKKISNCWFDGSVTSNNRACGAIVGRVAMGTKMVEHCLNTGTVHNTISGTGAWTGGLVGCVVPQGATSVSLKVSDSLNVGGVTTTNAVWTTGAVIGQIMLADGTGLEVAVENTYATNESYTAPDGNPKAIGNGTVSSGGVTLKDASLLLGASAEVNASNLDWTTYWVTIDGQTPMLQHFVKED